MSAHYFYSFEEWTSKCESLGYVFVGCTCGQMDRCKDKHKICEQTYAIKDGQIVSVFKHFINHGIVFDDPDMS